MAVQGAQLQSYNNELVKYVEELRERLTVVNEQVAKEEGEKMKLERDMQVLQERLGKVNSSLAKKYAARDEFERTLKDAETAFSKILESSQALLSAVKSRVGQIFS